MSQQLYDAMVSAWSAYQNNLSFISDTEASILSTEANLAAYRADLVSSQSALAGNKMAFDQALSALYVATIGGVPVPPPAPPPPPPPGPVVNDPVGTAAFPGDGKVLRTDDGTWEVNADRKILHNGVLRPETNNVDKIEVAAQLNDGSKTTLRQYAWGVTFLYAPGAPGSDANGWRQGGGPAPEEPGEPGSPPPPPPPPVPSAGWTSMVPLEGDLFPGQPLADNRWNRTFGVSHWPEGKLASPVAGSAGNWLYDHVINNGDGSIDLKVTSSTYGQLQQHQTRIRDGRVGVLARFGEIRPDAIVTPVWMYSGWAEGNDGQGRFELDFEVVGKRELQVNYHDGIRPGKLVHRVTGDYSNRTVKFEIDYSETGGFADFIVDDVLIKRLTRAEVEGYGMKWPTKTMFPIYDAWVTRNSGWTGAPYNPSGAEMRVKLLQKLTNVRG